VRAVAKVQCMYLILFCFIFVFVCTCDPRKMYTTRTRIAIVMISTYVGLTDGYVEVKFGEEHFEKTEVAKKSLNPKWNEDFRIEVPDHDYIQDNVIELRVWDYDYVRYICVFFMVASLLLLLF